MAEALPVFGQAAAAGEPGDRALDNPALGRRRSRFRRRSRWKSRRREHHELTRVGPLDDLDADLPADFTHPLLELRPRVATVGIELQQEWK